MLLFETFFKGQTPKSDIPPNIAPKVVTPENYLQICDSSATLIGQLATATIFGAMLGGIPLSGPYPFSKLSKKFLEVKNAPPTLVSALPTTEYTSSS